EAAPTTRAPRLPAVDQPLPADHVHSTQTVPLAKGGFDPLREPGTLLGPELDPVQEDIQVGIRPAGEGPIRSKIEGLLSAHQTGEPLRPQRARHGDAIAPFRGPNREEKAGAVAWPSGEQVVDHRRRGVVDPLLAAIGAA